MTESKVRPAQSRTFLATCTIAATAAFFFIPDGASAAVIWPCLLAFYALFGLELRHPARLAPTIPTYLKVEVLFLTFSYLLFFLPYQLFVTGAMDLSRSEYFRYTFEEEANRAVVLATIGLLAFSAGSRSQARWVDAPRIPVRAGPSDDSTPYSMFGVLALTALVGLYLLAGYRTAGEGRYTGTVSGGTAAEGVGTLILMLCMMLVALWVYDVSARRPISPWSWAGLALSLAWGVRLLLFSDRNSFFLIAIVGVGGLLTFRFRTSRVALSVSLLAALLIYNAAEAVRAEGTFSSEALVTSIVRPQVTQVSQETSFNITTITVRAGLAAVPHTFNHGLGGYTALGVAGVLPFVRGALPSVQPEFETTSKLLGYVMLKPGARWGVGTNVVSDAYIDFGVIGVPIVLYLLGAFAARQRRRAAGKAGGPKQVVMYLLTLALFAELPRYSIGFPVRLLAWAVVFLWMVDQISRRQSSSGRDRYPNRERVRSGN
ncbi:hypothetical protein ASD11_14085 [Aeromicrobium sp. Root495]|uniref:O-antigen polysaccharide polymerase Wzy n=1 Tax=Aeromicrobium sp. Root495 TaxID=1736550 RepID=UPI0006FEA6E3|nr:O-antigen polysaccharide polymerase Wzy [Aeromicrobium sp. Root495]KQY60562.1 hypothetical protein ASD11_14085 [Aeromicrobium sp. Root495]